MMELRILILLISSSYILSIAFFVNGRAIPPISIPNPTANAPSLLAQSPESQSYSILRLPSPNPHLTKVCDATDHPTECVTSVAPFLTGESDPISVLKMEMQALRQGFQNASSRAKQMNEAPSASEALKSCLEACLDMYESGIFDLDDAMAALNAHDIPKLKSVLSATMSDINSCDETFLEEPDLVSPLRQVSVELTKIASNNLAIVEAFIPQD